MSAQNAAEKQVWTVKDVAEYLRLSTRTVTYQAKEGKLPGKQIGGQWRFDAQRVKALLA